MELSQVLKSTGVEVLVALFQDSNDYYLDDKHLDLDYVSNGARVLVNATARVTSTDGQPGKYKGAFQVNYLRANINTILNGATTFTFTGAFPFRFDTMAAALKAQYGLVVEARDFQIPNSPTVMQDSTMLTTAMQVGGVVEFRVHDGSPRFVPQSAFGTSLFVKVVDPNGGQLEYLAGTRTLAAITSLDA